MTKYPLLFQFKDKVHGRGFEAEVTIAGRVLAVEETDGWWMYGVAPGGLAESGSTAPEAHATFRKAFSEILLDIAASTTDFRAFEAEVGRFFSETNEPYQRDWDAAVEEVRAGRVTAEMKRLPAETERFCRVTKVEKKTPALELDPPTLLAA
jgi:hypothetical protein